ncbi:MAG: transcriptional regulator [Candidatus Bathyarchaeota archaeon]|nr:transcriptional regulator [Candidatus Bathyarchaeota archaeon]
MPRRNELEHKALHVIVNNGNDGVLQSELWRKLDATSREGSRIALKLETKGLILREKELFEGRWTFRLYPKRKPASLNSIIDSPCLMCPNDARCGAWSPISPNECQRMTEWIQGLNQKEKESSGEI